MSSTTTAEYEREFISIINSDFLMEDDIKKIIELSQYLEIDRALKFISDNDYHLIRLLCKEAEKSEDSNLVTEIIKFINGVSNELDRVPKILLELSSFNWIIPNCFIVDETIAFNYLETLIIILTKVNTIPKSELEKLDDTFLDELLSLGFNFLDYYDTKWLHTLFYTMMAYQSQIISETYSPLIYKLYSNSKSIELSPEIISLLNRGKLEYGLLPQCLSLISDLFSYSSEFQVPVIFYSADIKVIIDVLLREIYNLDELDPVRWQFLEVLNVILEHEEYQKTKYKSDDISKALTLLTTDDLSEKDPRSAQIAQSILNSHFNQ
eukprot:gene9174-11245_t